MSTREFSQATTLDANLFCECTALFSPPKPISPLQISFILRVNVLHYCKIQTPNQRKYWNFTFTSLQD